MPNWCDNHLTLRATRKADVPTLAKFVHKAKLAVKGDRLLAEFYPEPDYSKITVKPTFPKIVGNNNPVKPDQAWWDWRVQKWGTKWDISEASLRVVSDRELRIDFMSAWSPPIAWMTHVSKKFPALHFVLEYEEGGMGFEGIAKGRNGKIIDKCFEVGETAEYGEE